MHSSERNRYRRVKKVSPLAKRALQIESLESRMLLSVAPADSRPDNLSSLYGSQGFLVTSPIIMAPGQNLTPFVQAAFTSPTQATASLAQGSPLSSLPQLSSDPSAHAK